MSRERRVAVTAPARTGTTGRRRPAGATGSSLPPEALAAARRLRRAQLRRAAALVVLGAALLLGLPVLIRIAPWLTDLRLFGIPGGWLAVAVLPYPVMAALAWAYLAAAERAERPPDRR